MTTSEMPKWVGSVASVFLTELKTVMKEWGLELNASNTRSIEGLGIQYRPVKESVVDMVESMWATGALDDKRKTKK